MSRCKIIKNTNTNFKKITKINKKKQSGGFLAYLLGPLTQIDLRLLKVY